MASGQPNLWNRVQAEKGSNFLEAFRSDEYT